MPTVHEFGVHRMIVDGDWVEVSIAGTLEAAESGQIHQKLAEVVAGNHGRAYLLCDISRLDSVSSETRRQISAWNQKHRISAVAVFGGGFTARTLLTLAVKAIKLRDPGQLDAVFVKTEAEARRWLSALRARR